MRAEAVKVGEELPVRGGPFDGQKRKAELLPLVDHYMLATHIIMAAEDLSKSLYVLNMKRRRWDFVGPVR